MEHAPAGSSLGRFGEHDDRPQPLSTADDRLNPLGAQPFWERRAASSHLEICAEGTDGVVVPGVQPDAHGRERATGGGVDTQKTSAAIEEQQSARREPREAPHTRLEQVLSQLHLSR